METLGSRDHKPIASGYANIQSNGSNTSCGYIAAIMRFVETKPSQPNYHFGINKAFMVIFNVDFFQEIAWWFIVDHDL